MMDSNVEFILHSGEKVRVMRPRQVGWGCGDNRYINIDIPQEYSEYVEKHKHQPRYFYVFEWKRSPDGTPQATFELQRFYMNEIANWYSIPAPTCEPGCDRDISHGGECHIIPQKLAEVSVISTAALSDALNQYIEQMPVPDFINFITNILGEDHRFNQTETLKIVQSAINISKTAKKLLQHGT